MHMCVFCSVGSLTEHGCHLCYVLSKRRPVLSIAQRAYIVARSSLAWQIAMQSRCMRGQLSGCPTATSLTKEKPAEHAPSTFVSGLNAGLSAGRTPGRTVRHPVWSPGRTQDCFSPGDCGGGTQSPGPVKMCLIPEGILQDFSGCSFDNRFDSSPGGERICAANPAAITCFRA